jgi:chromosome segregation ATPase
MEANFCIHNNSRLLKGKETKKTDGKQTKETVNVLNEEKRILELKLTSYQERHHKEVTELRTTLESLQDRYTTELKRFESTEVANQNEILELKKSLTSIERQHENRGRELEQIQGNLVVIKQEKEKIEKVLSEKNSEVNKWRKEALNDKAEIKFLRGSLNILEKEGLVSQPAEANDHHTE